MTPTEQPEDLRAAIEAAAMSGFLNQLVGSSGRFPGINDTSTLSIKPEFVDDILRLCEAAALAALPESIILTPWKNTEDMPAHQRQLGRNETIATAQVNIHSVFGGNSDG